MSTAIDRFLRVVGSPEIYLKSRPTRIRFIGMLTENVRKALDGAGIEATVTRTGIQEMRVDSPDLEAAGKVLSTVFGIGRINMVDALPYDGFDDMAATVADASRERVTGKTFAVRVRRHGVQEWTSLDAERAIGSLLLDASAGVDLTNPQVTVRARAESEHVLIVRSEPESAFGLPVGSQEPVLALLSGGIDSPVAAWMMLRTGCPVDFLHLEMECSVTDQALSVGHDLVRRWSHGSRPRFHVADFQPIKNALREHIDPRLRQVLLKQLMAQTAEQVAKRMRIQMLVTGDSLGQVSSQTGAHLVEMDRVVDIPILRPLVALRKEEIIARARQIGTFDMSIRTKEVCDLSEGHRVATNASQQSLARAANDIKPELMEDVLASLRTVEARNWSPGTPIEPAA